MSESPAHIVKSYEQELQRLRNLLTEMGGTAESQLALAAKAVVTQDGAAATRAVEQDPRVDELERNAQQLVIRLLALRQPVADDLRQIVAALKMAGDLERIGDYAANIAKRSIVLGEFAPMFSMAGLAHMFRMVQDNLKLVIDAIGVQDAAGAVQVWRSDDMIDEMHNTLFRELVTYMMEDPRNITPCTHLLFVAKNLERIGDHATNIAESAHYAATGEALPNERPRGNSSAYAVIRPPRE